ncbi:F0F1 ATP synthase subunit delta [Marinibactrum halimedae]|uniref:ATP synthase subunit delta n=1 Tax=Marinibactrum halimedae TaxID=1444977 RepID=A0AA37TDI3_9GAMM|nr:F0F1 ATP synthase subunit delta [Marinibactrum halimedae]MCD9460005.1 F0F1 ATP synthase subunit delta [Marinibactrum halimedae]GLS28226.1 ATP synthase subunit delta [Marinibactrum halimedae]
MAELTTLARPYARAAFEYAREASDLQGWSEMLSVMAAVSQADAVKKVMASPTQTAAQKGETFVELCGDAANEKGQNFIRNLAANKRLELLPAIHELFDVFKAQLEKSIDVDVISAYQLPGEVLDKLAKALSTKLNREVSVQGDVDPSLIGGALIRAGDTVIDDSVRGRLAKLAEAMNS